VKAKGEEDLHRAQRKRTDGILAVCKLSLIDRFLKTAAELQKLT